MRYIIIYMAVLCLVLSACSSDGKKGSYSGGATVNGNGMTTSVGNGDGDATVTAGMDFIYSVPFRITGDGFGTLCNGFMRSNVRDDGFVYIGGMRLKTEGISGSFDDDGLLKGIRVEFSRFVIGEAQDYSDAEKRRIHDIMRRNNDHIATLISTVSNFAGKCDKCFFDENDTDIYFTDGVSVLAVWTADGERTVLSADCRSGGRGCNFGIILERMLL